MLESINNLSFNLVQEKSASVTGDNGTKTQYEIAIESQKLNVYYGDFLAVKDIDLRIPKQKITCGSLFWAAK